MLARLKQNVWFGGRIFKTAVAVLLTASICHMLGWPPMFAVITAIVTIEPTARDSIKKAFERFPASAIGAAYSVIFTFMLGDSSFAYAFVAFFTIYTCYKLKLHAGTLVATLTGVAMISTIHDEYVSSFFVRLGTTTLGLTISSLVNLWVIRPDYSRDIAEKTRQLLADLNEYLQRRGSEILQNQPLHSETDQQLQSALKKLDKVETLCSYQRKDWPIHRIRQIRRRRIRVRIRRGRGLGTGAHYDRESMRSLYYDQRKIAVLRRMSHHLRNIHELRLQKQHLDRETAEALRLVMDCYHKLAHAEDSLHSTSERELVAHMLRYRFKQVYDHLDRDAQSGAGARLIRDEALLVFELAALLDRAEEYKRIRQFEQRYQSRLAAKQTGEAYNRSDRQE